MNSPKVKTVILIVIAGLLSACGSQPAEATTPASQPNEEAAAPTDIPAPTDTSIPADTALPTDSLQPTGSPSTESTGQEAAVSFADDILPILESRCMNCHGGERVEEGLALLSYADLMAGSDNGSVVTPGDADNSLMIELVSTLKMPKKGPKLTPPQVQIMIDWVNQGALNN
jgi:hypothetical protein